MNARALVVDLDGTLIKTDLLFETANQFLTRQPARALRMLQWVAAGRSVLKDHLAQEAAVDPAALPYNQTLLDWLKVQKREGRRLVLATASHRSLADAVARHTGVFDEVLATEGDVNLKGARKRQALEERFGVRGFDYVGNDDVDVAVWQGAQTAHVVGDSARLVDKAREVSTVGEVFPDGRGSVARALLRAMRPHQWVKNVLVFIPLLTAHLYFDVKAIGDALLAFIAFSLTASSVYLLNDMVDVADDRQHATKHKRPFASGDLSLLHGWIAWPLLLLSAFGLAALTLPAAFLGSLIAYFVLTLAYSLKLKQVTIIDVLSLAGLYTMRIVAGAAAVAVPISFWLLAFSIFIFTSLAFMKRFSELHGARLKGREGKLRGRGYMQEDLELVSSFGTASGYLAVLVLALYIQDSRTAQLYHTPRLIWLACPLLLYWISRAWLIAHRGHMHDDPIVFALKDRTSWLTALVMAAIFAASRLM